MRQPRWLSMKKKSRFFSILRNRFLNFSHSKSQYAENLSELKTNTHSDLNEPTYDRFEDEI